ncbi:MAG: hypothetical protein R3B48_30450 [Kofleriaceae bacterium]
MTRIFAYLLPILIALTQTARADTPKVGDPLAWPSLKAWLEDPPVVNDAAGKVVVHWFCAPRVPACRDDLARLVALREAGKIYIIGYINGGKRDAMKLDPVRSEIAAGAVSYGRPVGKLMKELGLGTGPAAIITNVDGKIAHVQLAGDPDQLDARDAKVNELVAAIKEFSVKPSGPSGTLKVGDRFEFKIEIDLAPWLSFNAAAPTELELTLPTEFKCDASRISGDKIKIEGRHLTAAIGCSSSHRGSYEVRAEYRFGYVNPRGTQALGADGTRWKFEIKE